MPHADWKSIPGYKPKQGESYADEITRLRKELADARAALAAERERCAGVCDRRAAHRREKYLEASNAKDMDRARLQGIAQSEANLCAAAIRAGE